jgi:hypothetical protein
MWQDFDLGTARLLGDIHYYAVSVNTYPQQQRMCTVIEVMLEASSPQQSTARQYKKHARWVLIWV